MKFIQIEVEKQTWETSTPDPEDEWDRASTDGSVQIVGAKLSENQSYNAIPVNDDFKKGDHIYLVWAQYSTGDSFGTDGGQYEICSIFKNSYEAIKEKERLAWTGCFESLNFVKVDFLLLQ